MKQKPKLKPIVLTIGVFDGVHRGHQALIAETVRLAKRLKASPEVLTFQDHPAHTLTGAPSIPFLFPRAQTYDFLKKAGAKKVWAIRFTKAFSQKTPEAFVRWLGTMGRLKGVVVGDNFRFGRDAQGDVAELKRLGGRMGFTVKALKPVRILGQAASSTRARRLLAEGFTQEANLVLGRPYVLEGKVVHGKRVGRKIGFPTANLSADPRFLPKDGVYACAVQVGNRFYRAGMNLGKRPTFKNDDHHRQAEVHLLRYYGPLYGRVLKVYLLKYLRPEHKFPSQEALVKQIQKDLKAIQSVSLKGLKAF